jgi:hypothetical protein
MRGSYPDEQRDEQSKRVLPQFVEGLGGSSDAAEGLNSAPLGADTSSQQAFLAAPQPCLTGQRLAGRRCDPVLDFAGFSAMRCRARQVLASSATASRTFASSAVSPCSRGTCIPGNVPHNAAFDGSVSQVIMSSRDIT